MNSIEKDKVMEGENSIKGKRNQVPNMGTYGYRVPNGYQINNIRDLEEITYKEKQRRREREEDE